MYARGMTTREIQGHLEEMYNIEVSPTLISNVTEAVIEEVKLWQGRPLEELYPISVQTTERYLGCKQRIRSAVNDRIGIEPSP
jgi:hypothetical protein